MTVNNKSIWAHCLNILGNEIPEKQFNTWIRPIQPIEQNNSLKLLAPNEFVVQRLKDHYLKRISELVSDINQQTEILLEVGSRDSIITTPTKTYKSPGASEPLPTIQSRLNPGFTFDGFVEGKSNQLAKAAAYQVAENIGASYNPLFIYGGVGLGKTHLMQAVGNQLLTQKPNARISYVHSERFVGDMVRGLQHNTISDFKRSYRSLDALLIDDIQFFAGKERSQEEFFSYFQRTVRGAKTDYTNM
jgi:chromosomal replication initiator protein